MALRSHEALAPATHFRLTIKKFIGDSSLPVRESETRVAVNHNPNYEFSIPSLNSALETWHLRWRA